MPEGGTITEPQDKSRRKPLEHVGVVATVRREDVRALREDLGAQLERPEYNSWKSSTEVAPFPFWAPYGNMRTVVWSHCFLKR